MADGRDLMTSIRTRPESPLTAPQPDRNQHRLLGEITCPNCWRQFPPEQLLFIARHDDLIGDEVAGETAYRRFLPTRFNIHGDAIDARGMACQQLACPRCHLEIPRPLIEMPPTFLSIVGVPASGKSYFLAAMTWELRRLSSKFGFVLTDGDAVSNGELQRNEEALFMAANPDEPVQLRKTETQGDALYQTIFLEGQRQSFPRPFIFTTAPTRQNEREDFPYRSLVLYDNAGEHFLPGQDSTNSPVTLHLAESEAIFFLFDPTQDPRFRKHCHKDDPQMDPQIAFSGRSDGAGGENGQAPSSSSRQEVILTEMAARVRKYKGMSQTARHDKPLVMILAKADVWIDHENFDLEPLREGTETELPTLDGEMIQRVSDNCRKLMLETCPELISAAEGFAERVVYFPISSLGTSPELVERGEQRFLGIRPSAISPRWVTVPMLWSMSQTMRGLVGIR